MTTLNSDAVNPAGGNTPAEPTTRHRLRVLVYGLNFSPELTGVGRYTGEMATFLAEHGYLVRVVTAYPYYPDWRLPPGARAWRFKRDRVGDLAVVRCPLWVPRRPTGFKRVLHLASFALSSF